MSKKYLIALDLDGTLLNDDKEITPKTRQYLNELGDAGHHIVIATGRPLRAAFEFQKELRVSAPVVSYNGALTSHPQDPTFIKRVKTLNRHHLAALVHEIGEEQLENLMVETEENVFLLRHDEELNTFFWNDRGIIHYGDPFLRLQNDPLTLIFLFKDVSTQNKARIEAIVAKYPGIYIRFWHLSGYAELYQENATKKDGLEYIAEKLEVPLDQIIAIGDAENDKEMLLWAPHSVWIRNGVPHVQKYAKMTTTEDNNSDGLINVIKRIIK